MTSSSSKQGRGQAWASATWATGQSIISGILYQRKDYDVAQHHRAEYTHFRDEILMPPAYDSIVPAPQQQQQQQHQQQPQSQSLLLQRPQLRFSSSTSSPSSLSSPKPSPAPSATGTGAALRHQPIDLPCLPRLLGLENLDEWDDILKRTLRFHGLADYVTGPNPNTQDPSHNSSTKNNMNSNKTHLLNPDQHTANCAAICLLMVGSFSADVRDTLLAYGYDPSEEDPRALHDLVLEALPKAAGEDVSTWMAELSNLSPTDRRFDGSLREFCLRLQYLRRRLYQAEPQPNDNLVLVMAVLGLARCDRYEGLSMTLGRELERGGLTWARLMGDLSTVHGREVRERRRLRAKEVDDESGS